MNHYYLLMKILFSSEEQQFDMKVKKSVAKHIRNFYFLIMMTKAQSMHSPFIFLANIGEKCAVISHAINEKLTLSFPPNSYI